MSSQAGGSRPQYHHGNLRSTTLEAVAAAIRDVGAGNVSIREVARRVGVSHRAPAHHFRDKVGLLTEFATQGYELMAETVIESIAADSAGSGAEILEAMERGYVRFALGHPEHFEVMFRPDLLNFDDPGFLRATDAAYGLLAATVQRIQAESGLQGRDPELISTAAWSLVHGMSALWLSGRLSERISETDPDRLAGAVSKLFVESFISGR
jgi:AcrR family transcriptional regulator